MKTIGIIGLGVMGGSFAARFKELGFEVLGFDIDEEAIQYALNHNMIDAGFTRPKDGLLACDTLVFCLYPSLLKSWIEENQQYIHPETVLLEICGVKSGIVEEVRNILRRDVEMVSIHPMCGRESRGIEFSSSSIFQNANFLIIPDPSNTKEVLDDVRFTARILGCRRISELSAREHDEMIAFLSQLTHIIAVSLMNTHENSHLVEYTGDSFRELTRIGKINETMWSELFLENRDLLLEEVSQFQAALEQFKTALAGGDSETMQEMMRISTERRKKFD